MATLRQKLVTVDQIESGKSGVKDLGTRLDLIDREADRVNESVMAMASAPVSTPQFNAIEYFDVDAAEKEVTEIMVTAGCNVDGDVTVNLNGQDFVVAVVAGDSDEDVAGKIQAAIDADVNFVAVLNTALVTVTAAATGEAVDATVDAALTEVVANVEVKLQGQAGLEIRDGATVVTIPNGVTYKVGKGNLLVLRNGVPQIGFYDEVGNAGESSNEISFAEGILRDGDFITFMIGKSSKLDYDMSVTYFTSGDEAGKVKDVIYSGDIDRTVSYTYNAEGKILTETVVEDGVTTTKTYAYDPYNGKIVSIDSVVA